MTTPDPTLAARLAELNNQLSLAQAGGSVGGWGLQRSALNEALCAAYRSSHLITLAEAEAMVRGAVKDALRKYAGREETGESITEKYLRRYPDSKKTRSWVGAMVHLRTKNGIWRPNGKGYTVNFSEAWVLPLDKARHTVAGIYEDHGGTYFRVRVKPHNNEGA